VKGLLAFVLVLAFVVAGAAYLVMSNAELAEKNDMHAQLNGIRFETSRQVALLAHAPDDKISYDRQQTFRKHAEAVEALRKRYPALLKPDAFIKDMEEAAKLGEKDKAKTAEYRARYDYVKEVYEKYIKAGNYKPVLTGISNGLRFDIVSITKSSEGGAEGLRWDVVFYGAPNKDQMNLTNMNVTNWLEFPELETSGKRKGMPKRTAFKTDFAPAMPYVWADKPWEWIPEWPANVTVGYYVGIPQFDSRTSFVEMSLFGTMRTQGATAIPVEMKWPKVVVDASWKGSPGSKWDNPNIKPLSDEDLTEQGMTLPVEEAPAAKTPAGKK
jgi:hypothetical protein